MAPAGDVNGDGIDDLVVGAPRYDAGQQTNTGAAWVVFGTGKGDTESGSVAAAQGFRIDGAAPFDTAGAAVAGAGDVNDDGLDDVLVGAPLADAGEPKDAGAAYVVLGRAATDPVSLGAPGSAAVVVLGTGRNDRLGSSVAGLPDANGDGRADLVVGAPRADRPDAGGDADQSYVSEPPLPKNAGAAYVLFTPGAPATIDTSALGSQGYRIEGARGRAGSSVATLPDWNGDGIAEIAVGAPLYRSKAKFGGRAYVVWGSAAATPVDLARLGPRGIVLDGGGQQRAGGVVASVGDLGGDARGDLAVGADYAGRESRGRAAGRVLILYARSEPGSLELDELGEAGLRIDGESAGDHAGVAIAPAGDVDGDGRDDVLVGAHGVDPLDRPDAGAAYVLYGGSGLQSLDLAFVGTHGFRIAGDEAGERLGRAVALAGDPSGDGRTDLALGSPRAAKQAGAVSLVYGPQPPVVDPIEELPPDPGAEEEVARGRVPRRDEARRDRRRLGLDGGVRPRAPAGRRARAAARQGAQRRRAARRGGVRRRRRAAVPAGPARQRDVRARPPHARAADRRARAGRRRVDELQRRVPRRADHRSRCGGRRVHHRRRAQRRPLPRAAPQRAADLRGRRGDPAARVARAAASSTSPTRPTAPTSPTSTRPSCRPCSTASTPA